MSAFVKHKIPSCCKQTTLTYEIAFPIMQSHLSLFQDAGFSVNDAFKRAGMFYIENAFMMVSAQFGTTKLSIKCKQKNCESMTNSFDKVITDIYATIK